MNKKEKIDLDSKKLLLSLLYSPGINDEPNEEIVGRTRIMKMVFLFEKEIQKDFIKNIKIENYEFDPYYYGPFSRMLIDDLNFFTSIGMIDTRETDILIGFEENNDFDENIDDNENYEIAYKLSEIGVKYVKEKIWGIYSNEQKNILKLFKNKINEISLDSLLNYVYNKYPDKTVKSLIADKYLKDQKTC